MKLNERYFYCFGLSLIHISACRERLEIIEKTMVQQKGVTEALKAADQMEWVRSMNSIHNRACLLYTSRCV